MITNLWALKGTVVTMPVCRCGGLIQRDHWLYETGLGLGRCLCESGVHCMPPYAGDRPETLAMCRVTMPP